MAMIRIRGGPHTLRLIRWTLLIAAILSILHITLSIDRSHHSILDSDLPTPHIDKPKQFILDLNDPTQAHTLTSPEAESFCRSHGYTTFHTSTLSSFSNSPPNSPPHRRRVYELLLLNTELDWLEIRLRTLYHHVDYFIVVESATTFTGLPKPLYLAQNWTFFEEWKDKLIYHELKYPPGWKPGRTWDNEDLQRDASFLQVVPYLEEGGAAWEGDGVGDDKGDGKPGDNGHKKGRKPVRGDVLLVADMDELPRPETIAILRTCNFPRRLTLRSKFYYYSFQYLHFGSEWPHPQATYYLSDHTTILPTNLRNGDGGVPGWRESEKGELWNAGWHCSSCFRTIQAMLNKMGSFSHTSLNTEEYRDKGRIVDRVSKGLDLWDREGQNYERVGGVEGNGDVPGPLMEEEGRKKWGYMLDRDGVGAGFEDYVP